MRNVNKKFIDIRTGGDRKAFDVRRISNFEES